MAAPAAGQDQEQRVLVVFRLAGEYYGLDVTWVQEIVAWQPVTRVPRTPAFIDGIIHLRGRIIPVLDVRSRCGLPASERGATTRIVVVEMGHLRVGLVVDSVSEVVRVPAGAIQPPAEVLAIDRSFVEGIVHHDDRWLVVLRPDRILAPDEQEVLKAATLVAGEDGEETEILSPDGEAGAGASPDGADESPDAWGEYGPGGDAGTGREHPAPAPDPDGGEPETDRAAVPTAAGATSGEEGEGPTHPDAADDPVEDEAP